MPVHDAKSSRRELADNLDFVCFSIIILSYGAGAILIASLEMVPLARASLMFVAVSPLGVWLLAMVTLRRFLEKRGLSLRGYRRQLRQSGISTSELEPEVLHVAPTVKVAHLHTVRGTSA